MTLNKNKVMKVQSLFRERTAGVGALRPFGEVSAMVRKSHLELEGVRF